MRFGAQLVILFVLDEREQQALGAGVVRARQFLHCGESFIAILGAQLKCRHDLLEHRLDRSIGLLTERFLHQRQHRRVSAAAKLFRSREAHFALRGNKLQCGQRASELAPQAVVDADVFLLGRNSRQLRARYCIGGGIAFDNQNSFAGSDKLTVGKRLQNDGGFVTAQGDKLRDGFNLLVAFAERELFHRARVLRKHPRRRQAKNRC